MNTLLFSLYFTSKTQNSRRCKFCFTIDHMNGPHQYPPQEYEEVMLQQQSTKVIDKEINRNSCTSYMAQMLQV